MLATLRNFLLDPRVVGMDADSEQRIETHRNILSSKKMMAEVFREFYNKCLEIRDSSFCKEGLEIELGAGVSFFKSMNPGMIVTDIVPAEHLDTTLDAENMKEIEDQTVRAMYGLNVFHHFSEPRKFFKELQRVLKPGGGCVMIEPYHGTIARPFYQNLHASEHFNPEQSDWESLEDMGAMSNANQALSYIVFVRDREQFESEFPDLEIVVNRRLHNYLRYFLSGGINFKQLLPDFSIPLLKLVEQILRPFSYHTALHYVIAVKKRAE